MPVVRTCRVCGRSNRVPATHLADSGRCGACKSPLPPLNEALEADPGLINREPFGQGWIFVLKIDNADDLKQLKNAEAYRKQIG